MSLYKIADVIVEMSPRFVETSKWYEPYIYEGDLQADFSIVAPDEAIEYLVTNGVNVTQAIAENMILCNRFNGRLLKYFGGFIHSSALKFENKVYLFSGKSGIGKSTHTKKWCRLFPGKARVINDDKPSFRMIDGKCYIYGTPFAGGTDIQLNEKGELGGIIFLERSEVNRIERMSSAEAIRNLIDQSPKKTLENSVNRLLDIYSDIITNYPVYKLYCANNDNSVDVAFEIIK